ncbi:MAG: proline racemase family protein, partial [Dermatophilaceae bacterium]
GVATVLVETGMVEVTEPETVVRLDTPAGLVTARVAVDDGQATSVTLENIPSYVEALDAVVEVPGFGRVRYDLAYGGNFYAFVKLSELGLPFERSAKGKLLEAGLAIMDAINEQNPVVHPEQPEINTCHHVYLEAPDSTPLHGRHAMAIHPGWFDRSPCGTGTSARLAVQYARGTIGIGEEVVNESFIGSRFGARVLGETSVAGRPAIRPSFTGRAWITGTAQYLLDPTDPFPAGFEL